MTIYYRLIEKDEGILLNRLCETVGKDEEIEFLFENARENSTAIFNVDDLKFYRSLDGTGRCRIKESLLQGRVGITVFTQAPLKRWFCEKIEIRRVGDAIIVIASDLKIVDNIRKTRIQLDKMTQAYEELLKRCDELDSRITGILEGYDIL